jgi:rubrerythrin
MSANTGRKKVTSTGRAAAPAKRTSSAKGGAPAKAAAPAKGATRKRAASAGAAPSDKVLQLMIHAYAMEAEAAERYAEFADAMEVHNNSEVAELFRKMARIENLHAQQIRESMGWHTVPPPADNVYRWEGLEAPETADHGDLHYLMTPHHALQIARLNEERARRFYAKLAIDASDDEMRRAANEMSEEEADHVRLIDEWLSRTPAPEAGWSTDLDPPNYNTD